MEKLDYIKKQIEQLYEVNPNIHISVKLLRPKVIMENSPAVITGVYKNIFQIEEKSADRTSRYTFQYNDVLIVRVTVSELDYVPTVNIPNKK